jgi:putative transposase
VLETALQVEIAEHLGYERGDRAGRGSGNSRNGSTAKTIRTDIGEVRIEVPLDRAGTFAPAVIPKHSRRLAGFDATVLSLYARVILSFRVSQGCDLRRRVVDSVADGTLAA